MAEQARPVLAVSLAVFREGRVLLARRARPPLAGLFSLPGGHVEFGETLVDAALRELREEVSIEARVIGFNQFVELLGNRAGSENHYVIASFVGEWVSGEGRLGPEVDALRWVAPDAVDGVAVTEGLPVVVRNAWTRLCQIGSPRMG